MGGVTGTYFWIDPAEDLIAIFLAQAPDRRLYYRYLSRELVGPTLITGPKWGGTLGQRARAAGLGPSRECGNELGIAQRRLFPGLTI